MLIGVFKKVFAKPSVVIVALLFAITILYAAILVPNLDLLASIYSLDISLWGKMTFTLGMLTSLGSNFTLLSASYTVLISALFGINVVLIYHYLSYVRGGIKNAGAGKSVFGLLAGVLGVGCASCGALLLTPILGTALVGSIATMLPLAGAEFGILGVLILAWSTYSLVKKINNPYS